MSSNRQSYLLSKLALRKKEAHYLRRKCNNLTLERLQRQEELAKYRYRLQQDNTSKSDFLANMSHEIRTPLNIILGMANLLAETVLTKTQTQYLNSLRVTGGQLMEILNNVLEFSRIEAGKIIVEPEPFSLHKIIHQIEASAMPLCLQKKLEFRVIQDPLLVMERVGDPLKIFQIILNLVNNAVKFTPEGVITFSLAEDFSVENGLVLTVIDTGIGISTDQQQLIFDRFTQANDSLRRQQGGAGLGLAISKKLLDAMGGTMHVKSAPGRGSLFSCHLQLPVAAPSERRRLRHDGSLILPENFPELHILVVDDIHENIEVISSYLAEYPVRIQATKDGQAALDCFTAGKYDIILMDIRMPVMDGISATQRIRDREEEGTGKPQIILAVTAHAFYEQRNMFLKAGFDGVLTKPFFKRDLINTLFTYAAGDGPANIPEATDNKSVGYCLENDRPEELPVSLREFLPELFQTLARDLELMKSLVRDREFERFKEKAHGLKGVAGMFGFQKLASLIEDLSKTITADETIIGDELFSTLELYIAELKKQSGEHGSSPG